MSFLSRIQGPKKRRSPWRSRNSIRFAVGTRRTQGVPILNLLATTAELPRYIDALGSEGLFVCRLVARPDVLESRLRFRHREDPERLLWHLDRVGTLTDILEAAGIDDLVLDSSDILPVELAAAVRQASGWD